MTKWYKKYVRLSCRNASQLLVKRANVSLSLIEQLRLAWHLRLCDPCARFNRQVRLLDQLLARNMSDKTVRGAPKIRPARRAAMAEAIDRQSGR